MYHSFPIEVRFELPSSLCAGYHLFYFELLLTTGMHKNQSAVSTFGIIINAYAPSMCHITVLVPGWFIKVVIGDV
jgi:hypothetical protein